MYFHVFHSISTLVSCVLDVNTDDEDEEDEAEDGYEKARHELDERNAMMEKQTEHARKARAFMEEVE